MDINYKGYYISRIPAEYIDTMESGSIKTLHYRWIKFFDNGYFVYGTSQDVGVDFNLLAQRLLSEYIKTETNIIFTVGKFERDSYQLFLYSKFFASEEIDTEVFTILSEKVLLDENLEEYDYRG